MFPSELMKVRLALSVNAFPFPSAHGHHRVLTNFLVHHNNSQTDEHVQKYGNISQEFATCSKIMFFNVSCGRP